MRISDWSSDVCSSAPAEGAEHHKSQQRRRERAVQREQVQLAAQRVFGGIGAGGGARQGRSWRRRGVEYRGREEGGPDQQDRSGISKPTLLPFTGEGARRACPREGGGRMRGASAAKGSEEHTSELQSLM